MDVVLSTVGSVASTLFSIAGDAVTFVIEHPICLLPVGMYVCISGVNMARSFLHGV